MPTDPCKSDPDEPDVRVARPDNATTFPRRWCTALTAFIALGVAMPGAAATFGDPAVFVQVGEGDRAVRSATVGALFEVRPDRLPADSRWSFLIEAALGEWFVHDPRDGGRVRFNQFGVTPSVRYRFGDFFVEAGIGGAVIAPHFVDNDRRFSTGFNFGDHLGIGARFGEGGANEIVLRAEHFSNGGIRNPNPGQNFVELRYGRRF